MTLGRLVLGLVVVHVAVCNTADKEADSTSGTHSDSSYEITFELGLANNLVELYSFPNSYTSSQTLEQTMEHYLLQCLQRDLVVNGNIDVTLISSRSNVNVYNVTISGDSNHLTKYNRTLNTFLRNGLLAVKAAGKLKDDNKWNDEEWRLFLPHGLAISNHRSVQLLHFPPDYSLPHQDYLGSKTSKRWESLLTLNDVPPEEVTLYESIIDIAPIAAPASAGETLSQTYGYFEDYMLHMILLLLESDTEYTLPVVAYGEPVRKWVSDFFDLGRLGVNEVKSIKVTGDLNAPLLGANHPSEFWYAAQESREKGLEVMREDLISACWQARMGTDPQQDALAVLQDCQTRWDNDPMAVCVHTEEEGYGRSHTEAEQRCRDNPPRNSLKKTEL